jgi:hypothetical protein
VSGPGDREDDGRVDVEAAFADIVARWDAPGPPGAWPDAEDCADTADGAVDGRPGRGLDAGGDGAVTRGVGSTVDGDPTGGAAGDPTTGAAGGADTGTGTGGRADHGADGGPDPAPRPSGQAWGPSRSHVGGERVIRAAREDDERERALAAGGDDGDEAGFVPPEPPPLPRGDLVSRLAWAGVLGSPLFFLLCALVWRDVPRGLVVAAILAFVGGFVTLVVRLPSSRDDGWDDGAVL